jgi:hypothetical protein
VGTSMTVNDGIKFVYYFPKETILGRVNDFKTYVKVKHSGLNQNGFYLDNLKYLKVSMD